MGLALWHRGLADVGMGSRARPGLGIVTLNDAVASFNVPHLKRRCADDEEGQIESKQNAERLANLPPRNGLGEHEQPDVQVIGQKPMLQIAEVGNVLHDEVHEHKRDRQNGRRRRLHVETGKHERQPHDRAGLRRHQ